jgi:protein SCO1/2
LTFDPRKAADYILRTTFDEETYMKRRGIFAGGPAVVPLRDTSSRADFQSTAGRTSTSKSRIPNPLVNSHDGRRFRFYDDLVRGRVVTINFFFTSCGEICPLVTQNLRTVQDLLGDRVGRDVLMLSLTLQPELETPEILRDYADIFEVKPGWLFLTGAPAEIEHLRTALGFASSDPERDKIADNHTGILRYGNDALDRWAACPGAGRPEAIVKAITTTMLVGDAHRASTI